MLDKPIKISNQLIVGPQLSDSDIQKLAKHGIKTVVNLSAKGEHQQMLTPDDEQRQVEALGVAYVHKPISMSNLKNKYVDELIDQLQDCPTPIYIHCLFGQRSMPLGLIFHALRKKLDGEHALEKSEKLGFVWHAPFLRSFVASYLKARSSVENLAA